MKAIYIDEDEHTALREAEQPVRNFVDFNVSPMDSLARTTPAEKQRLIDAGYAFYAADDFLNLRNLSYPELLEAGIVFVGSPQTVGQQLLDLWKEFRFDEMIVISHYGGIKLDKALKTQDLFAKIVMPMVVEEVRKLSDQGSAVA